MKWEGKRESEYITDEREVAVPKPRAKAGIGVLLIIGALTLILGGDPKMILSMIGEQLLMASEAPSRSVSGATSSYDSAESKGIVSVTLASLEDIWSAEFQSRGKRYPATPLVLFREVTSTGCGYGESASGPFYCPADSKIYFDLSFLDELERLGGRGDFALAYVVAHEVGHHVQNVLRHGAMIGRRTNDQSVATELQADCYAGVWAYHAHQTRDLIEEGDIEEGLNAASAVGDDHIQRSAGRAVSPESFTHGSSDQRRQAFMAGFTSGRMESCAFDGLDSR